MKRVAAHIAALFAVILAAVTCACCPLTPRHSQTFVRNDPADDSYRKSFTPVWIAKEFTQEQRLAIHEALFEWNDALNGYEEFQIVSDELTAAQVPVVQSQIDSALEGLIVYDRTLKDPEVQEVDAEKEGVLAWVGELGGSDLNIIAERIGTRDLRSIVLHELGHVLGLEHIPVKGALMYPSYRYSADCIDQVSIMHLATARGWDWHHMNYCQAWK